ncbi:MAG: Gfo/Idh/MocA family protein [Planctomycetota bacterium]|jgi:predicted dehydrogenase
MKKVVNRRSFLKRSAALGAGLVGFPYIVRSSALGKAGTIAPSNRLVMAQVGCGSMGRGNLKSFLGLGKDVYVAAVCDVDRKHAEKGKRAVAERSDNQDCRIYEDYRELLDKEDLDIVSHALPDHWHAPIAVACARKGIDMYGEKPMARTIAEGRAICDAVDRYGVVWQTGSWQRSIGTFHQAAELVRNGRIGKVEYTEVGLPNGAQRGPDFKPEAIPSGLNYDMWLGSAPYRPHQSLGRGSVHWDWRWIMDYSGGQLTDWAGHHIDIAHWGLDLERTGPVEIAGRGKYPVEGIYDVPYAYDFTCTYANGVKIRVANAGAQPRGMGACWYGENGWIHVNRGGIFASDPKILREKIGPDETQLYKSTHHQRNFIDCVKSRRETIAPAEVAHRSISAGLLGEIAMLTERTLKWNPDTERFIGDEDANRYLMRPYRAPWHL